MLNSNTKYTFQTDKSHRDNLKWARAPKCPPVTTNATTHHTFQQEGVSVERVVERPLPLLFRLGRTGDRFGTFFSDMPIGQRILVTELLCHRRVIVRLGKVLLVPGLRTELSHFRLKVLNFFDREINLVLIIELIEVVRGHDLEFSPTGGGLNVEVWPPVSEKIDACIVVESRERLHEIGDEHPHFFQGIPPRDCDCQEAKYVAFLGSPFHVNESDIITDLIREDVNPSQLRGCQLLHSDSASA